MCAEGEKTVENIKVNQTILGCDHLGISMEASHNHAGENDSVVVAETEAEPSSSSNFHTKNEAELDSDGMGTNTDALAEGLSSMLSNIIRDFDCRAQETLKSQDQLSSAIDRLTRELDQLLEDAPLPFVLQHAAKISSVRKRVFSLNSLLKSIQGRIDNIDRMLSMGASHEKTTTEGSG